MEVLLSRSSFNIKVASSSSSSFIRDRTATSPPPPPPDLALDLPWNRFNSDLQTFSSARSPDDEIDYRSDSSSSIGDPDRDDEESEEESISSSTGGVHEVEINPGFASLGSLEESLPIKRGLSNHFSGKSKSFMNLAEANCVKDIEKPENSFNKRRRVLIASKLAKKCSFYAWPNPKSMPMLAALTEEDRHDEDYESPNSPEDHDDRYEESKVKRISDFHCRRLMSFKSRSFSLADLQQHPPQEH